LDREIQELERQEVDVKANIARYEALLRLATQKCDEHLATKKEQEVAIRRDLEERSAKHEELSKNTEDSLDTLIATRAITSEAVKRFARVSSLLLRIPRIRVNDSIITNQISQFFMSYLNTLSPTIESLREQLKWTHFDTDKTLEWLEKNSLRNPKLLEFVREQYIVIDDLCELIESNNNGDAIEELKQVPAFHLRKVVRLITEQDPKQVAVERFSGHVQELTIAISGVLTWKESLEAANTEFLQNTQRLALPD